MLCPSNEENPCEKEDDCKQIMIYQPDEPTCVDCDPENSIFSWNLDTCKNQHEVIKSYTIPCDF